jgi:hypothetical protein
MNHAQQTVADWTALRAQREWRDIAGNGRPALFPDLVPVAVTVTHEDYADPVALEQALAALGAVAGWVERQSRIEWFEGGAFPVGDGDFDAVAAAELAGANVGWSVRAVPGGWRVTRIEEGAGPAEFLCHDTPQPGVDRLPGTGAAFGRTLRYRVYWRREPDHGWRPCAARLLDYTGGEP